MTFKPPWPQYLPRSFSFFPHCQHTSPDYLSLALPGLFIIKSHDCEPCLGAWKEGGVSRGAKPHIGPSKGSAAQKLHLQNHSQTFLDFHLKSPSPSLESYSFLTLDFMSMRGSEWMNGAWLRSGFIEMRSYKPVSWNQATEQSVPQSGLHYCIWHCC